MADHGIHINCYRNYEDYFLIIHLEEVFHIAFFPMVYQKQAENGDATGASVCCREHHSKSDRENNVRMKVLTASAEIKQERQPG